MADTQTNKGSAVSATITGMAIGAAVGAGAVLLSDEKKRKKVMKNMNTAKDKAVDMLQQAKGKVKEFRSTADDTLNVMEENATQALDEGEEAMRKTSSRRLTH